MSTINTNTTTTIVAQSQEEAGKMEKIAFIGGRMVMVSSKAVTAALDQAVISANKWDGATAQACAQTTVKAVDTAIVGLEVGAKKACSWLDSLCATLQGAKIESNGKVAAAWKAGLKG